MADALRDAGEGTGGEVAQAGTDGERVHDLADLLGVLFFAIPASILLVTTLPGRIRQVRELNAVERVLDTSSEERRRRSRCERPSPARDSAGPPYTRPDRRPAEGRYDQLIEAAYDEAGLRRRAA